MKDMVKKIICIIPILTFGYIWYQMYEEVWWRLDYNCERPMVGYIASTLIIFACVIIWTIVFSEYYACVVLQEITYIIYIIINIKFNFMERIIGFACELIGGIFSGFDEGIIGIILDVVFIALALVISMTIFAIFTGGVPGVFYWGESDSKSTSKQNVFNSNTNTTTNMLLECMDDIERQKQRDHIERTLDDINFKLSNK